MPTHTRALKIPCAKRECGWISLERTRGVLSIRWAQKSHSQRKIALSENNRTLREQSKPKKTIALSENKHTHSCLFILATATNCCRTRARARVHTDTDTAQTYKRARVRARLHKHTCCLVCQCGRPAGISRRGTRATSPCPT